jgi:hypothetical protein
LKFEYRIERVEDTETRRIMKDFINYNHSYINFADRPSRKLYWMLHENENLVGVFGLGSAFSHPKAVKNFMKVNNLEFNNIANNIVYCLSYHQNKNAGSKLLSLVRKDAIKWWHERYGDRLIAFQTFVLPSSNRTGAIYKADNWICLGETSGGKTQKTRTLYGEDREKYPNAEIRTFKSGETKYILREFTETEKKLIFMKLNSEKEIKKVINA